METLPETQEAWSQETVLSYIDKEITKKLPEFLELVERRYKASTYNADPKLFLLYSKLSNCLNRLQERGERG